MKRQGIFPGVLLIGVGLIFLLQNYQIPFINELFSWPSILVIIGLAFLFQAYIGKDYHSIFTGVLLLGLGVHFHGLQLFTFWPNHWAMFTLIIGVAFLFRYSKTKKDGLVPGVILLLISLVSFLYSEFVNLFGSFYSYVESFWPVALIGAGIYLLFFKK
ncbi:MAG: LiaI-LiaF-like domain-containing protein [Anaerobacillus sp.]|uniref:LiaI-LiaF-like domain-containing protein n=1 Tax=Anaerobacillus sp. TaxID=1872506 RepID=UPI00391CE9EB